LAVGDCGGVSIVGDWGNDGTFSSAAGSLARKLSLQNKRNDGIVSAERKIKTR